jgi:transcriptional regulator with GAF, ATPase, and Fis domain
MWPMREPPIDDASTRVDMGASSNHARLTAATVEVVAGPDAGVAMDIPLGGLVVGGGYGCDLRLSDPLVSRRHFELLSEPSHIRLVDLHSKNGTFIGNVRVQQVLLSHDVLISAGSSSLALRLSAAPLDLALSERTRFGNAIGVSTAMRHVFSLLEQAAATQATVLLEGDSGTGKDVLANALHLESARSDGPFVIVDCGAIPEALMESELFGHEKGAFSGAVATRRGAFEMADGGTLFLDEIGELPLELQPKLLRVLESRSFRRVGGERTLSADVRLVAATNRKLREAVRNREFREDLFYRLAVVHVRVPRLADRADDILPLAQTFLRSISGDPEAVVPPDLGRMLSEYSWPGNARELRNVVERFATFRRTDVALLFDREAEASGPQDGLSLAALRGLPYHEAKRRLLEAFHRVVLDDALERAGGSVPRAAELLELRKTSLYRMLQRLDDPGGGDES